MSYTLALHPLLTMKGMTACTFDLGHYVFFDFYLSMIYPN